MRLVLPVLLPQKCNKTQYRQEHNSASIWVSNTHTHNVQTTGPTLIFFFFFSTQHMSFKFQCTWSLSCFQALIQEVWSLDFSISQLRLAPGKGNITSHFFFFFFVDQSVCCIDSGFNLLSFFLSSCWFCRF